MHRAWIASKRRPIALLSHLTIFKVTRDKNHVPYCFRGHPSNSRLHGSKNRRFESNLSKIARSVTTIKSSRFALSILPCYECNFFLTNFREFLQSALSGNWKCSVYFSINDHRDDAWCMNTCSCIFQHGGRPKRWVNKVHMTRQRTLIVIRYIPGVYGGKLYLVV